jgi:hypothetical protein
MTNNDGANQPAWPFEQWRKGDFVRYTRPLALPNVPGRYTVKVGLFRGNDRARATSPSSPIDNDAVTVATIEVTP